MRKLSLAGIRRGRRCKTTPSGRLGRSPFGPGESSVCRSATESALGGRYHVCEDPIRVCVCGVCGGCVLTFYRGLACSEINADSVGSGCAGTSAVGPGESHEGSYITVIVAASTSRFVTPSDWMRRGSTHRLEGLVMLTTMPWLKPSTACTKRK